MAVVALVGEAAFLLANAVLPWTQAQDVTTSTMSELALGPAGSMMGAAFVVHGIGIAAIARVVRPAPARVALTVAGLAIALLAAFPTDPPGVETTAGDVHLALAGTAFVALPFGFLLHARRAEDRHGLMIAVVALAATALLGIVLALPGNPLAGLMERLAALVDSAWMARTAVRVLRSR